MAKKSRDHGINNAKRKISDSDNLRVPVEIEQKNTDIQDENNVSPPSTAFSVVSVASKSDRVSKERTALIVFSGVFLVNDKMDK